MKIRIEIPTGVDHYESETLIKDAHEDELNMISSQYDVKDDRWVEMQEKAFEQLDENVHTLEDFDKMCSEIADEMNAE